MAKNERIAAGLQPVKELLKSGCPVKKVWFEKGKTDKYPVILSELQEKCIPYGEKSARFLEKISDNKLNQGIIAIYTPLEKRICFEHSAPKRGNHYLCLYLDRIQDPHNLGAIVRSADFFDVDQIFYPANKSAPFNATALKASAGGGIHTPPLKITSPRDTFQMCRDKGLTIVGTSPDAKNKLTDFNFKQDTLLIIGNEGEGVSKSIIKECDHLLKLPALGNVSSLNASVFTGLMLYQVRLNRGEL